jgi:hypothetical protein
MRSLSRALAVITLISLPSFAHAAPVTCPEAPAPGERVFTVDTNPSSTCYAFGEGANDINGNPFDVIIGDPSTDWELIDKDDADGDDPNPTMEDWLEVDDLGNTSGAFTIDPDAWDAYDRLLIGFKVGGGRQVPFPDWAVFELSSGVLTGDWLIQPNQGSGLSHMILYGMEGDNTITEVPEPATMLLVGGGLMAGLRRRRNRR